MFIQAIKEINEGKVPELIEVIFENWQRAMFSKRTIKELIECRKKALESIPKEIEMLAKFL